MNISIRKSNSPNADFKNYLFQKKSFELLGTLWVLHC